DQAKDSRGWPLSRGPRQGSYVGLFAHAKRGDERWWAHDPDVWEWWCREQAKRAANEHPTFGDHEGSDEPETKSQDVGDPQKPKPPRKRFPVLYEHELVAQPQLRYLIDDWITEDSVIVIWGKSQSLKSFLLLDISLCMTHGTPWHGKQTQQGAVAYV